MRKAGVTCELFSHVLVLVIKSSSRLLASFGIENLEQSLGVKNKREDEEMKRRKDCAEGPFQ